MYMYLSDRIRRMFLSGACPQNLSPKNPLSLKDQRFLQKTKADKNLNKTLVKQQKLLREKHIGLLQKHFNETGLGLHARDASLAKHAAYSEKVSFTEKNNPKLSKQNKTIYLQQPKNALLYKQPFTDYIKEKSQKDIIKGKAKPSIDHNTKGSKDGKNLKLSNPKGFFDNTQEPLNYGFSRKSLNLFVQHLKVQKENIEPSGPLPVFGNLSSLSKTSKLKSQNKYKDYEHTQTNSYQYASKEVALFESSYSDNLFDTKNEKTDYLKINQGKLALKDINSFKYRSFSYLYDHESLKTCIVPQLFKNQKPISRAKTLLQERKKIALLYGQLAKKDIAKISRKASILPGFFEDNMFTLLESRVDVCVFRAGFSSTIASARQLIRNGFVLVNGKKICSCKRRARPGDYFTFKELFLKPYRSTTFELYNLCLSSNFLKQWVFLNKIKFLRKLAHACKACTNSHLSQTNVKGPSTATPESLLFHYLTTSTKEHYKPGFCSSLYWGFFLYKLDKIPFFSCFFDTKRKLSIGNLTYLIKKNCNLDNFQPGVRDQSPSFASLPNQLGAEQRPRKALTSLDVLGMQALQRPIKGIAEDRLLWCNNLSLHKNSQESSKVDTFQKKESLVFSSVSKKRKNIVLLNLIALLLLKKQKNLKTKQLTFSPYLLFRKNIPSSNLWAIWGQKPLHLEISHKTGSFIYMYKPQKIICPVRLDFKL